MEVRVVQDIEELRPKLQFFQFRYVNIFESGEALIRITRSQGRRCGPRRQIAAPVSSGPV